ncbi:MAG: LptE family protein [FCB group bacterium]|nr:LptE family protein [FCB group bacterium]
MNNKRLKPVFLTIMFLGLTGCGFYSMAGSIPPHIRSIAIPLVINQTAEYGVEENITDAFQNKFTEENILQVVPEKNADSILKGTIVKITDTPYTFNRQEEVTEYRYTVTMEIEWIDVTTDKVLLKKRFSGWGAYGLTSDISTDQVDNDGDGLIDGDDPDEFGEPRSFAQKTAVKKIAEDVLNDLLTSW